MDENWIDLRAIVTRHTAAEGENATAIPGLSLFKATTLDAPVPSVYNPCLCFIVQGSKQVTLDTTVFSYKTGHYLAVSVELPLINQIIEASPQDPYLLLKIDLNLPVLSELLQHVDFPARSSSKSERGIFVGELDEELGRSVMSLVRLLERPAEIPVLGGQTLREIFYRVLNSPYGASVAQIVLKGSPMQRIAAAIQKIKTHLHQPLSVEALADSVSMSLSSFHAHFKAVTSMSPLQYQKTLRLIEARSLLLNSDTDVTRAAYRVGYESVSQFSREYVRMFGVRPGRDSGR